ncbi:MAG: hypothetical protein HQ446_00600 [Polaromonas sp.]|nr:hypothetical protein [Polaromonas sp.]
MNYTTLQAQVANYLHRTDLTTQIPTFIELAEAYLFRELHIKELQISVTGTTSGGYATLPSDFGSVARLAISYAGAIRSLDYVAKPNTPIATSTSPAGYALENNKLRIWAAADGQAYTLYYIPVIANLSASVPTNWLLTNAPEIYLDSACLQGAKYLRNGAEADRLTGNIALSLDSVKRFSERRGQPYIGGMQIKVRRG